MPLTQAMEILSKGGVIGLPTETVYGLAGDATKKEAIARIYALKNRPHFNPLIVHGYEIAQLQNYGIFNTQALALAEKFWPGPLTLVLPRTAHCPTDLLVSAGMKTIGVRIPRHPVALDLLRAYGIPLAAPSANLSNQLSPTTRKMVLKDFSDLHVLEGGACAVGLESTIIMCAEGVCTLLRPGGIGVEEIEAVVGKVLGPEEGKILAPGMLKKHYAPRTPLRLLTPEESPKAHELLLGFGECFGADLNLSVMGDVVEAAANLFSMLHILDELAVENGEGSIAVAPIPKHHLGLAIHDRLMRACG